MLKRPTLIFDTSAINKLVDDPECKIITLGFRVAFFARITEANVAETIATSETGRRHVLLEYIRSILGTGECIKPHLEIVDQLVRTFSSDPDGFDWRTVSVIHPALEEELVRGGAIADDSSKELSQRTGRANRKFERVHASVRPYFQARLRSWTGERPTATELLKSLYNQPGKPFWDFAAKLYEKTAGSPTDESMLRRLCDACPPFRATILSFWLALYDRCLRDERGSESYRAGRIDVYSAVYLPYCDDFVTDDERQLRFLRVVADAGQLGTRVRSYKEFRNGLVPF